MKYLYLLAVVRHHMILDINFVHKFLIANLASVFRYHMGLHVRKFLATVFAHVHIFQMLSQMRFGKKFSLAMFAADVELHTCMLPVRM